MLVYLRDGSLGSDDDSDEVYYLNHYDKISISIIITFIVFTEMQVVWFILESHFGAHCCTGISFWSTLLYWNLILGHTVVLESHFGAHCCTGISFWSTLLYCNFILEHTVVLQFHFGAHCCTGIYYYIINITGLYE